MFEGAAELNKILPDGSLRYQPFLLLEVLDHPREVPRVSQLQHDVQLVVFDEGGQVLDHVRVI